MYQEPIFLEPVFQERIWGGNKLTELFGYEIPSDKTGEAWVISAHENGPTIVSNGPLTGENLLEVWKEYPNLFGKKSSNQEFPLLIKIIDANDNLSVQVHPDDAYAQNVVGEPYGKTECWYILDCEKEAEIIYGHQAQSREDFRQMVDAGEWCELLKRIPVKKGDFFYVPSGTIHAIGKGIVLLETQQSSDITYRVYDYDRVDAEGKTRDLHVEAAIDVINFSDQAKETQELEQVMDDLHSTQLINDKYFTVYHWQLNGKVAKPLEVDYLLVSVINGKGAINIGQRSFEISKGDNFGIPATVKNYDLKGDIDLIVSHE